MNGLVSTPFVVKVSRRWKRWERHMTVSKRQLFVIITVILTIVLVLTQLVSGEFRYPMVALLSLAAYFLSAFGLREDLKGIEWMSLLILPTLFTTATALFYFLLPVRWLTRLPVAALYAVGMYALLLTENIYNVAAIRTIALLRAAHSVGFVLTLVTYFLLTQTLLAFRLWAFPNMLLVGVLGGVFAFQSLWAMELESQVSKRVYLFSLVVAVIQMELAWVLSFWPIRTTLLALFYTTTYYGITGLAQQYLTERLYKRTIIEFMSVMAIVFLIVLFTARWRDPI
ncbi:hypothetical protein A2875_00985 [Candidatus Gottesmanbacteria bacterium RIFCSPHIGHO2_01_FULL_46_14]|uniref:Uncharacterized protein n=2 Tax=Candidatus Gottesmaniibacteriota TaxID=1752720 RepID=A0A1F5ZNH2_9BACT|nr:MAG: hypothetical protein UX71_C0014G0006 [Parcubacteria group bacterium GW2011_GWA1_47_10]OGG13923.1 MAG: hypothetical protein A2875_00985 [Candidatus Gottesmanbacteria bacterium RIFCSPHIGHO2_01_FULL_46_14]OGG29582.1 MAG: hypothetical protein A2971_00895 [Candidatus Gottesmanbacteria bacterium RIFCSPLOWO2_01_FULL_46_21]